MNTSVADMRQHAKKLAAITKKGEKLRKQLHKTITELPDNAAVKRVEPASRCFTISSLAVFSDPKNNPTTRMDPWFFDFKSQYETIAEAIDKCDQWNVLNTLTSIAETGHLTYAAGGKIHRFHPDVVNHIRTLLGKPANFSLKPAR